MLKSYYTLAQLLLLTASVAVFCVVLMNENKWLRATYVTAALGIGLNALIAAIFARGERRAFSQGFVVGLVFFAVSMYSAAFTLPFMLTLELLALIKATSSTPPSDEHFYIVTGVMWILLTATSAGYLALAWHRSVHAAQSGERDSFKSSERDTLPAPAESS